MLEEMIQNFENRMEKMQKSISKDLEELKNKHRINPTQLLKLKNILEGISIKISEAEE